MVKRIFIIVLGIATGVCYGQPAQQLSLKQAIQSAVASNVEIQQSRYSNETEKINWEQSRANRLPNLSGNLNHGVTQGRSIDPFTNSYSNQKITYANYGLNSNVILFNGFSLKNTISQNELIYRATEQELKQAKDNVSIDVVLSYLDVLTNEDLLIQFQNQEELTRNQLKRLMILDSSGAIPPSQVYDMQGQLANDQVAVVNAQNNIENARIRLFRLMNLPYQKEIVLEKILPDAFLNRYENSSAEIYSAALERFPQVKAAEFRRQAAIRGLKAMKGQLLPAISLSGAINTNYSNVASNDIFIGSSEIVSTDYITIGGTKVPVIKQRDLYSTKKISYSSQLNNNLSGGLNLNVRIPIFNNYQARNRIRLANLQLRQSELLLNNEKTSLQQFIEEAWSNMNAAWNRYRLLVQQVEAYRESFRAAEIRFNAGLGTIIDYLTAKNNLERANISLLMEKYNYLLRTKVLDYYQGKLDLSF